MPHPAKAFVAATALVVALWCALPVRATAEIRAVDAIVADLIPELEAHLDPALVTGARAHIAAHPDGANETVLAMIMTLRHHFVEAAWFYALQIEAHGEDVAAWNNLGLMLDEAYHGTPDAPGRWLGDAADLLRAAHLADPDNAAVQSNLGHALVDRWRADPDAASLEEAVGLLRAAADADPSRPYPRAHLAAALLAMGDEDGARAVFDEAHEAASTSPVVIATALGNPALTGAGGSPMPHCATVDVTAMCKRACPCTSIIGCLDFVTCNIANADYQSACRDGGPIPNAFNCETQFPEYGIMIPGLQSGFSILAPGFKFHVGADGQGGYKWEFTVGPPSAGFASPYVKAGGRIDPHTGDISGVDADAGIKFNVGPRSGPLGEIVTQYGIHPGGVSFETSTDRPVKVEAWNDLRGFFLQH